MKVLLINNYHYRKGGADGVYFNTAQLLAKNGHEVFYFSAKHPENLNSQTERFFAKGNDYRTLSLAGKITAIPAFFYNKNSSDQLLKLLEEIKPDLAHIHLFMGGLSTSILLALKKKNIPVVHSVHDYRCICPAYLFLDGKTQICEKCKDGFFLHCAIKRCSENSFSQSTMLSLDAYFRKYVIKPINLIDKFIFVSKFIKIKHIEFDSKYEMKAEMLYNFIPELNSIVPNPVKGQYFLYFGRISREKGVDTLIEAASRTGIKLKIIGTGPLLPQLKDRNFDNVELLGFKSGSELWSIVQNASFIIVPSEWYENNPLTIIEAYSLGKPVIGARIGGIPEIIEEGKTGYLFHSGNTSELEQLLLKANNLSDEEYRKMSANARKFADLHFHPDNHYNDLMNIYNNVIKTKNKI